MRIVLFTLAGTAIAGAVIGVAPTLAPSVLRPSYGDTISDCRVTDGNTIRCGDERKQAEYVAKWDNGLRVARLCPSAT